MNKLLFSFALVLSACGADNQESSGVVVASAFGDDLYRYELRAVIPSSTSAEDSVAMANSYINTWLRNKTILSNAKAALDEENIDIERKVDDYRNSLLVYAFEKRWVEQKLDTVIHKDSLNAYYQIHKDIFKLNESIVKLSWFSVKESQLDKSKRLTLKLFQSDNAQDQSELEQLLIPAGIKVEDYNGVWMRLNKIAGDLPISEKDLKRENSQTAWTVSEDEVTYFVKLIDVRLKTEVAPLVLVHQEITSILLNKKKTALLEKMRFDLYKDAELKGNITIND